MNSLPKTVTRQRRDCDLNPSSSAPESSTLTTRLPSHPLASIASAFSSRSIALLSLFPLRCSRTIKHELDLIILKFLSWRRFSTVVLLAVCGDGVRKRSHVLRAARRCAAPVKIVVIRS